VKGIQKKKRKVALETEIAIALATTDDTVEGDDDVDNELPPLVD